MDDFDFGFDYRNLSTEDFEKFAKVLLSTGLMKQRIFHIEIRNTDGTHAHTPFQILSSREDPVNDHEIIQIARTRIDSDQEIVCIWELSANTFCTLKQVQIAVNSPFLLSQYKTRMVYYNKRLWDEYRNQVKEGNYL